MGSVNKDNLSLRTLTAKDEINRLFALMDTDFPAYARIPLCMLRSAIQKAVVKAVFLTDGSTICGYALYQYAPRLGFLHILYLAVLPPYRSEGLGGLLLRMLNDSAPEGILLDVESPDAAKAEEDLAVRQKRIAFYERNGFAVYPGFQFNNVGHSMKVMANVPLPAMDWLSFYRALYDQAYGLPLSRLLIRPRQP